ELAHERRRDHDLGLLRDDEFAAAGDRIALGVICHSSAHPRAMLQIVIWVDVDDLIERPELGVPEASQLRVSQARRQPFFIALYELGYGPGAERIGADFVDHRRVLQVTGVSKVICRRTDSRVYPLREGSG